MRSAPNIANGNDHGFEGGGFNGVCRWVRPEIDLAERRKLARDRGSGSITPGRHGVAPRWPRVIYRSLFGITDWFCKNTSGRAVGPARRELLPYPSGDYKSLPPGLSTDTSRFARFW